MEIKYSEFLASLDHISNHGPKCTFFNVDLLTLDERTEELSLKQILFMTRVATETKKHGTSYRWRLVPYRITRKNPLVGLPTGRYTDYKSHRYIELDIIPDDNVFDLDIISRSQAIKQFHTSSFENAFDKEKYILLYGFPELVWVRLAQTNIPDKYKKLIDNDDIPPENKNSTGNKENSVAKLLLGAAIVYSITQ